MTTPRFLEVSEAVWVRCEEYRALPGDEVACIVRRMGGEEELVIVRSTFFDPGRKAIRASLVADVEGGWLVDFPSGDRLALAQSELLQLSGNGSPLRS